jgi:hypothetical protein
MKSMLYLFIICFSILAFAQDQIVTVTGTGAMNPNQPFQVSKLMARRAAVLDGYRLLLEHVKGIAIDSQTSVKDFITESDTINGHVEGWIRGAQITATRYIDGTAEVDMVLNVTEFLKSMKQYTFFDIAVHPGANIFIIDASGSMKDPSYNPAFINRWEMALQELRTSINNLKEHTTSSQQYFGMLFFANSIKGVFPMVFVDRDNKNKANNYIFSMSPDGGTNYYAPLQTAINWLKSIPNVQNRTIYLLGDGEPNQGGSWMELYSLAKTLEGIKIHIIYSGKNDPTIETRMKMLADLGKGIFVKK